MSPAMLVVALGTLISGIPPTPVNAMLPPGLAPLRTADTDRMSAAGTAELERRGDEARARKAYAEAEGYYRQALAKTYFPPQRATLFNKLGIAELQMQQYHFAQKDFERAIKADHKSAEARNNLGAAYYLQKQYGKAIGEYRKALRLGDEASFHNNLAGAYFMRKQLDLAAQEYRRAFELDPEVFERSSRTGISAQLLSPENRAEHHYLLARLFAQMGYIDRSLEYLRKAMEDGYAGIDNVYKDEAFAALRRDPRFDELMKNRPYPIPQ